MILLCLVGVGLGLGNNLLISLRSLSIDLFLSGLTATSLLVLLGLQLHLVLGALCLGLSLLRGLLRLCLLGGLGLLGLGVRLGLGRLLGLLCFLGRLLLHLFLDGVHHAVGEEDRLERHTLGHACDRLSFEGLVEGETSDVLALLDDVNIFRDSLELKQVALEICLREFSVDALPDLLTG